ncbi:unnamed protein product [Phytophthora lilii]|uniref:Unnamed protein product n=1 Tax=Phytophthora lilii TaxID=2077276 RepID=A0A9W6TD26_9STRA|nr:unnamed protein product [Phytophthora lilii]
MATESSIGVFCLLLNLRLQLCALTPANNPSHSDLKPENVLISAEGHIKLTDFGLAKEYVEGQELLTVCGTKEYMAPEMLLGKGYDSVCLKFANQVVRSDANCALYLLLCQAVDWWSLGALAHEMLTGKPPFRSKNAAELHKKIISAKVSLCGLLLSDICCVNS